MHQQQDKGINNQNGSTELTTKITGGHGRLAAALLLKRGIVEVGAGEREGGGEAVGFFVLDGRLTVHTCHCSPSVRQRVKRDTAQRRSRRVRALTTKMEAQNISSRSVHQDAPNPPHTHGVVR